MRDVAKLIAEQRARPPRSTFGRIYRGVERAQTGPRGHWNHHDQSRWTRIIRISRNHERGTGAGLFVPDCGWRWIERSNPDLTVCGEDASLHPTPLALDHLAASHPTPRLLPASKPLLRDAHANRRRQLPSARHRRDARRDRAPATRAVRHRRSRRTARHRRANRARRVLQPATSHGPWRRERVPAWWVSSWVAPTKINAARRLSQAKQTSRLLCESHIAARTSD